MKGTLVTCSVPCLGTGPLLESTRGFNLRLGIQTYVGSILATDQNCFHTYIIKTNDKNRA